MGSARGAPAPSHWAAAAPGYCESFSTADVAYLLVILFASRLGVPPAAEFEHLNSWLARCAVRPAITREIEEVTETANQLSA